MTGFRRGDRGPAVAEVRARLARLGLLPGSQYAAQHAGDDPQRSGPLPDDDPPSGRPPHWSAPTSTRRSSRPSASSRNNAGSLWTGWSDPRRSGDWKRHVGGWAIAFCPTPPPTRLSVRMSWNFQKRLNSMGFRVAARTATWGVQTDEAIREFQRNTGIRADGVCGPATFRALGQLKRTVGKQSGQAVREKYSLNEIRTGVRGKSLFSTRATVPPRLTASPRPESTRSGVARGGPTDRPRDPGARHPFPDHASGRRDAGDDNRAAFANEVGADLVLALNLADDPDAGAGVATYYFGRTDGSHSVPGQLAATLMLDGILERTDLDDRRPHGRTWDVLRMTRMPAVRIECGNLAAPGDRSRLSDPLFVDSLARAIADSVERFFSPEHVL